MSGTQKLLSRIKALFEPSRPTPPAPEAEPQADVALIPAAAAVEVAEPQPHEPATLFEMVPHIEDVPAPASDAPPEASTDEPPTAAVGTPGGLTLRLESERGSRSTFEVTKSGATIGRGPESTIQLADLSVSRKHARITYKQGSYWLSDLGSMGGTWIDGAKLAAPRRVAAGQTIDIGLCRLVVVAAAEGETSGAAKGPSNGA